MLQTETPQPAQAPASLQHWLGGRSRSERATIARLWGLPAPVALAAEALAAAMCDAGVIARVLAQLGAPARAALTLVQQHGGTIAAPLLEREHGGLRSHAGYPNPRAYLLALERPPTPTEQLWALGLLVPLPAQAPQIYAIPPELLALLPPVSPRPERLALVAGTPPAAPLPGDPALIEQLLLAILILAQDGQIELTSSGQPAPAALRRIGQRWAAQGQPGAPASQRQRIRFVLAIGTSANLLRAGADARLRPTRAALDWLRAPRQARAEQLLAGWAASSWDELAEDLGIVARRAFTRDLAGAKRAALGLIGQAPPGAWIALDTFVAEVRRVAPDFARPDGRYDTWGLRDRAGRTLDGFLHWQAVEGAQLHAIIGGPLHWLGLADLGLTGGQAAHFRLTALGSALLAAAPPPAAPPAAPLVVQPNFEVVVGPHTSLFAHFQLARLAEPGGRGLATTYHLTRRSIQKALQRGILFDELLRFLFDQSTNELPQNVAATLREWAGQYGQVTLRHGVLLESADPLLLEQIRRDQRVRMPEHAPLSERAWLLREADAPGLAERLRKAGYGVAAEAAGLPAPLREPDLEVVYAALEFYAQSCERLGVASQASAALRKRVARLLADPQRHRALRLSREALDRLLEQIKDIDSA